MRVGVEYLKHMPTNEHYAGEQVHDRGDAWKGSFINLSKKRKDHAVPQAYKGEK